MKAIALLPGKKGSAHLAELRPVRGLDRVDELFEKLTGIKGAMKVFCEAAPL